MVSIIFLIIVNLVSLFAIPEPEMILRKPVGMGLETPPPFAHLQKKVPIDGFRIVLSAAMTFAFFVLGGAIPLLKNVYLKENENEMKEAERKESELHFLKAQLNPHFILNALNSIYSLVRDKSNDAPEAVLAVSEMMRYMLYESNKKWVPLVKEIEYIQNYIALQRLRYDNGKIVFNIMGNYSSKNIEPLLLIPFVENAFKYGTNYQGETDIAIKMEVSDTTLLFLCTNQIGYLRKDNDQKGSGVGLTNIKNRLALLYPSSHTLTYGEEGGHYVVKLSLEWKSSAL